ncbi:MAG: hypothetical protein HLUCCA11_02065 [Phormidesmis priestleyi Ana]|uniref:PEP-CTERM protein-sorting domain n=1 Tax=Phormidesmis priestleyi Ana TaxID=1666911 RepID=A0A0P8C672_9CYAN|nr:MAG: hypothetical protein HLUCCA11_02065 [Phormidesmis priestleyi Ana]
MLNFTSRHITKASAIVSLSVVSIFSIVSPQSVKAAVLSQAIGDFSFTNFSRSPLSSDSFAFTSTLTTGSGTTAIANADALFETLPSANAFNFINNSAFIADKSGSALAESESSIIGSFLINSGETFSFDFFGLVDLLTFTEQPTDFATAVLETRYAIFNEKFSKNSSESSAHVPTELDFLSLFGQISTPDGADDVQVLNSNAVTLNQLNIVNNTGPTKTAETLLVEVSGRYERLFDQTSTLTLAEFKLGTAFGESKGVTDIPESSSPLIVLLGMGGAIAFSKRRFITLFKEDSLGETH